MGKGRIVSFRVKPELVEAVDIVVSKLKKLGYDINRNKFADIALRNETIRGIKTIRGIVEHGTK